MEFKVTESGWYRTRDGRDAEVVVNPGAHILSIVGYVASLPTIHSWYLHGNYYLTKESAIDLVEYLGKERPKKPKKFEAWVNFYADGAICWATSKQAADKAAEDTRIARIECRHITWEVPDNG